MVLMMNIILKETYRWIISIPNSFRKLLTENLYHKAYVFGWTIFRKKLRYNFYKDYKSKRNKDYINGTQPTDESELKQKKLVWEYLNELSIRQIQHEVVGSR